MCSFKSPSPPTPTRAPRKTSASIQKDAEKDRLSYGYGGPGSIASTMLTTPLGVTYDEAKNRKGGVQL